MSFGRNPYVSKAEAAEQKAKGAPDDIARIRALRDAAHQWDRAAEREKPGKMRTAYEANAVRIREQADAEAAASSRASKAPAAERLAAVRERVARAGGVVAAEGETEEPGDELLH